LRVLAHGDVQCGDTLTLVERPFPQWTIEAVNAVAYSRGGRVNVDAARELATCPALSQGWRAKFRDLVE
jgi:MOSC domain-containing protein YiiM